MNTGPRESKSCTFTTEAHELNFRTYYVNSAIIRRLSHRKPQTVRSLFMLSPGPGNNFFFDFGSPFLLSWMQYAIMPGPAIT